MGILQWLGFNRQPINTQVGLASPMASASHLDAVTWAHLLDLPEDSRPVTRAEAMAIPAIARGRNLICGQAARLAITAVTADGTLAHQPDVIAQPERFRARSLTVSWIVDAMLFHGRAWLIVTEREGTKPRRVAWAPEHVIAWDPQLGQITAWGEPVAEQDVIRVDGPNEGVLDYGRTTLRAARSLARAAARTADNPVPSIDLHQVKGERMTPTEIEAMIAQWMRARRGANGGVAFTNESVEARTLGVPAEQLLIQGRQQAEKECAQLLNLPAWAVDAVVSGSSITYSNVPSRARELIDITLAPLMDALTGRLSLDDVLPRGTWAVANPAQLLRGSFADRMNAYAVAITAGIYSAEECRAMEAAELGSNAPELTDPARQELPR